MDRQQDDEGKARRIEGRRHPSPGFFSVIFRREPREGRVAGFRVRLLVAMMLVVSAVTLTALYFGQRSLIANVERDLERAFEAELAALQKAHEIRHAALVERCRALVRKPRIRAAFED